MLLWAVPGIPGTGPFAYDPPARLVRHIDSAGTVTEYVEDGVGNLVMSFISMRQKCTSHRFPRMFRNRRMHAFSKLGGDDIQKGMEWVQAQWKNHLSFPVELKPTEQGVYVNQLRTSPPAIFRKGVGLDRASCLAALEIFTKSDPENYIRFENTKYEEIVQRLQRMANPLSSAGRKLCMEGVKILIDEAVIIPLGQIHFSILAKPNFEGWVLTPLNQLDLGLLSRRQSGSK